jgi:hypothetical protein
MHLFWRVLGGVSGFAKGGVGTDLARRVFLELRFRLLLGRFALVLTF